MTHYTKSYAKSPAPAFDAVEDIKEWLGDRYDTVATAMRSTPNPEVFALVCSFAGISGYPVKAWYEHFHGEGSWAKWFDEHPKTPTL